MFRITLRAGGISPVAGSTAAEDIEREFRDHRPWHERVTCSFADGTLTLVAENDFDDDGRALCDELSDCLCAHLAIGEISDEGEFAIVSVETI